MATFVGEVHGTTGSGVDVPAATQDGDVMIAAIWSSQGVEVDAPAGWTAISTPVTQSALGAYMYYRVASSEPSQYTWGIGSAPSGMGHFVFRDVDTSSGSPIAAFAKGTGESNNTVTAPQVTTSSTATIITFNATYRFGSTAVVLHESADAGVEDADWGQESPTSSDYVRSGAFYHKLDVDPGTRGGYHIDLSGSSVTAACTWTVALEGTGITGDMAATAPFAMADADGSIVIPGGELAATVPAALLSIDAIANLARGDLAVTAPLADVSMLSVSKIEGGPNVTAPVPRVSIAAHRDMFGDIAATAPAPKLLMGAETRIFGARVVVVRPESRVRYPF